MTVKFKDGMIINDETLLNELMEQLAEPMEKITTLEEFKVIVNNRLESCTGLLLGEKNIEYSRNNDKLHNFKKSARIDNETPERALWGMWKKHIVSISDMINDIDHGIIPTEKMMKEKFGDNINYTLLLEGLIRERYR